MARRAALSAMTLPPTLATPACFLLGGHDLEMAEIRRLLVAQQAAGHPVAYLDLGLNWAKATWAAYLDHPASLAQVEGYLAQGYAIYGIELLGTRPDNPYYHLIDHHNDLQHLPTSLEQVAALLGTGPLSRWQQLVAANDRGYIPAMLAMGASPVEVDQVRRADRQAQGVTEAEEAQAEADLRTRTRVGHVTVVRTQLAKFSPLTDRLFGLTDNRLLVYNDNSLNYYGQGKARLVEAFANLIAQGHAYHGGGDTGFFGLAAGHFAPTEIEQYQQQITQLLHHA